MYGNKNGHNNFNKFLGLLKKSSVITNILLYNKKDICPNVLCTIHT